MEVNDKPADSKSGFQSYVNQYNCQYPAIYSNEGGADIASALGQGVVGNLKFIIKPDKSYISSGSVPSTIEPHECNPDPYVKVSFPNGGELLEHNKEYEIKWKGHKFTGEVKIELIKGNGVDKVISDSEDNDGTFLWSVGTDINIGNSYKIKVTSVSDQSLSDESDASFSIIEEIIPDYFLMPSGTGNIMTVIDTLFYDDQGETGDYSTSFSGEVILTPGRSDKKVKIKFLSFDIEDSSGGKIWDTLNIYNGSDNSDLIGRWFGKTNPGTIISTASDGALKVTFNSDEATEGAGWKAHITLETVTGAISTGNSNSPLNLFFRNGRVFYQVPFENSKNIKIELFSINGTKLGTLVDSIRQRGVYSLSLVDHYKDLANGVYILNMKSAGFTRSMQIVLR